MPNTIKTISLTDDDKSYLTKLLTQSTLKFAFINVLGSFCSNLRVHLTKQLLTNWILESVW